MTIVPVCNWLNDVVSKSYLSSTKRKVIVNGIDLKVFTPIENRLVLKQKFGFGIRFMILAVSSVWRETKGFYDMLNLSTLVSENDIIVMVGLTARQIRKLPPNIIGIERTENVNQLVKLYSVADVFINPTYQDTFPTVNIEALACGTPVVTYDTGGSAEIVDSDTGSVLKRGDVQSLLKSIEAIRMKGKEAYIDACRQKAIKHFDKSDRYQDYLVLYKQLIN